MKYDKSKKIYDMFFKLNEDEIRFFLDLFPFN
jgi:hypothetical protein